jgi:hypothetical protein
MIEELNGLVTYRLDELCEKHKHLMDKDLNIIELVRDAYLTGMRDGNLKLGEHFERRGFWMY